MGVKKLTSEELIKIQDMNTEFTKAKVALGDLELKKQGLLKHLEVLMQQFSENEKLLIDKYGLNSVINIKTGEVTEKES